MREHTLLLSEAQQKLTTLPGRFSKKLEATIATRNGKKVLAILPYDTYKALLDTIEALQETLEIMKDEETVAALRESIQALERGETVSWEVVQKELEGVSIVPATASYHSNLSMRKARL